MYTVAAKPSEMVCKDLSPASSAGMAALGPNSLALEAGLLSAFVRVLYTAHWLCYKSTLSGLTPKYECTDTDIWILIKVASILTRSAKRGVLESAIRMP